MNAKSLIVDKLFSFGNWITILAVIFMIAIFSKTINYALGIPTEYVFIWAISSGVVFSIFLAFKNIPPPYPNYRRRMLEIRLIIVYCLRNITSCKTNMTNL